MKKTLSLIIALTFFVLTAASCGSQSSSTRTSSGPKTVNDVLSTAEGTTSQTAVNSYKKGKLSESDLKDVDVDLTSMSSTMVYSEVYNMVTAPENYMGKKVLMKGNFGVYEGDGRNYYACIIADATACCSQGIEFVLSGNYKYPQDYPEMGTEISVVGTFDTYYEGSQIYCQLIDAKMA